MTDQLDVMGVWWLPEREDHKVPGRFTWSAESGGELQLVGQLRPDEWQENVLPDGTVQRVRIGRVSRQSELSYSVIHGQVDKRAHTLLNCFSLSRQETFGTPFARERVHVNRALDASAWFINLDDVAFDRSWLDLRHLATWIDKSGLSAEYPVLEGSVDQFAVIVARRLPSLNASYEDATVSFVQTLSGTGDGLHSSGVEQTWLLKIAFPGLRKIEDHANIASDVQDLVSIAAGLTADFGRVTFEHPDVALRSLAGTQIGEHRDEVVYRARWSNRSRSIESIKRHDCYFSFDDFDGTEGLQRWLAIVPTFRTELRRVMATRYSSEMYLEDRIMNTCAALDSFDKVRRTTGEARVNFVDRIKECVKFAGQPFTQLLPEDTDRWAAVVKEARHDLAHHKDRFRNSRVQVDHIMAEQLFWLFTFCMFRVSDAPRAVFESIVDHQQIQWLIEQTTGAAK